MSILEVLTAHHEWDVDVDFENDKDQVTCPCGWKEPYGINAGEQHRIHVAQMIEEYLCTHQ